MVQLETLIDTPCKDLFKKQKNPTTKKELGGKKHFLVK